MISIDTETTGTDLYHGCKPYLVTTCDENDRHEVWEWDVDPITREPIIDTDEKRDLQEFIRSNKSRVLHNSTFDVRALQTIGIEWNWEGTEDTLAASHLLSSNTAHDLTSLSLEYLGINVKPYEDRVKEAVLLARKICKRELPEWRIAEPGMEDLPSVKSSGERKERGTEEESYWKADMWLLRAMVKYVPELLPDRAELNIPMRFLKDREDHPWEYLCYDYANSDTASTIKLWNELWELIQANDLEKIYRERLKILPIVNLMENKGITLNKDRLEELKEDYSEHVVTSSDNMVEIAERYSYELDKTNGLVTDGDSLRHFCFGYKPNFKGDGKTSCKVCGKAKPKTERGIKGWRTRVGQHEFSSPRVPLFCSVKCHKKRQGGEWLKLPEVAWSEKTQLPSTNKKAMEIYSHILENGTDQKEFVDSLVVKRKLGTSLQYINSYEKFWLPEHGQLRRKQWYRLHPSLNPFGTDTLRWSSHNPSQQVISKQKDHNGRNLRYIFGPGKGRIWYALDYDNLELRIPAYECREPAMLELFEHPDKAPFFGSYHLLIVSILQEYLGKHGDKDRWKECMEKVGPNKAGELFKELYKDTWYQWTKNGNFAELYGAVDTGDGKGTADIAFHIPNAQSIIAARLTEKNKLNQKYIEIANSIGYVETMPDKSVDPDRGYPIRCKRGRFGVVQTTPLNYHVQGTACWVVMRAMIKVQELLDEWNRDLPKPQYFIIMNVHDEIVLDFPVSRSRRRDTNLPKVRAVRRAMESIGKDIGVKLTCGLDRHSESWLKGIAL